MEQTLTTTNEAYLAQCVAGEDLRIGDTIALLDQFVEVPSYMWNCDCHLLPPHELVRIQCRVADSGQPLRIKAICLPFLLVKSTTAEHSLLDVRKYRLVRLNPNYARTVWKCLRRQQVKAVCN